MSYLHGKALNVIVPPVAPRTPQERVAARRACARAAVVDGWPTGDLTLVLDMLGLQEAG